MSTFKRMTARGMLEVIQAFMDGAPVQYQSHNDNWISVHSPEWNFSSTVYRIKPVPRCFTVVMRMNIPLHTYHTKYEAETQYPESENYTHIQVREVL